MTDSHDIDPGAAEADRLIAAALTDHIRMPAPRRLREQLMRTHVTRRRSWLPMLGTFVLGAAITAAISLLVLRPVGPETVAVDELVGDHQRIVDRMVATDHIFDVQTSNLHNVKPWFAGRIDFVPPVSFEGNEDFPLLGGDLAVVQGHKAAAFVYGRRLHRISLLAYLDPEPRSREENTVRGFHVITWAAGGIGMAMISDVAWDDLRQLEGRLH
jgi:anti-sigma factor RsiW